MRRENDVSNSDRPGYYLDAEGNWCPERRKAVDRRNTGAGALRHEQRKYYRRKADRELYETDHKAMIKDALDDFAEDHKSQYE